MNVISFRLGSFAYRHPGVIPLHNHPGMTVFSKLLFGSMHVKSYDWVTEIPSSMDKNVNSPRDVTGQHPGSRLAKVHIDSDFTAPCSTSVLYPAAGGNMHSFRALSPSAILDVLGPPYSDPDGRHCAYYHEFPYTRFSELFQEEVEGYTWLEERERPENFIVVGAEYGGPQIEN
ncbi:hypothetical protein F0562_023468 [Nyssa sinensis]|uniref:cysteine dioxygenase n=1 Tax=Nyssa sinensis TaxID=561372 RepID=A0A5J5BIB7_9ASTE|nr:hypothetical protein F0562_023468 [Nyssa sinensis]